MTCKLGTGDLLRLEGGSKGALLHCLRGTIWLTNGDGVDYLVRQGQSFPLEEAASAVVEALGSAEIRLDAAAREGAGARAPLPLEACLRMQLKTWPG